MKRVVLSGLIAGGYSGVPRYAVQMIGAIDRVAPEYPDLDIRLVTTPSAAARLPLGNIAVDRTRGLPRADWGPSRLVAEQIIAPFLRADLVHYFDMLGPLLSPRRRFTATSYDAKIVDHPEAYSRGQLLYKRRVIPWAVSRACGIIALSEVAKEQTVRHFGADPGRVHVIPAGPGLDVMSVPRGASQGPREPFLLHVGQLSASKNLPFLIRAFERMSARARLVLVGRPAVGFPEVEAAISASSARERIELHLDVRDEQVESLYRDAGALVMPSLYEGFGFTPLEAMKRGCAVIASDIPAVSEIAGGGALLLPLGSESVWAAAMDAVVSDAAFAAELRRLGEEHVGRYSWEGSARQACAFLQAIADA